jgi:hypothetical protein
MTWSGTTDSAYWTVTVPQAPAPVSSSSTNLSGQEELLNREAQRLAEQESQLLELHRGNNKDDNNPWFKFIKWLKLFEGKDLQVKILSALYLIFS